MTKRQLIIAIATSIASGILLVLSFPRWNQPYLAWCALMPLTYGILRFPESTFRQGFMVGIVFFWVSLYWLGYVTVAGWLALGVYLALYFAVWAWGMARFCKIVPNISGIHHLALAGFGATSWVGLEWLRSHLLTGFPWNLLGVSQFKNIALIQMADMTGVYGISFLIIFFNIAFFTGVLRMVHEKFSVSQWRYELTIALFLVAAAVVWGMRDYTQQLNSEPLKKISVALIQPNIPQSLKWVESEEMHARDDLKRLTLEAASLKPDLIVWPETALTSGPSYDSQAADYIIDLANKVQSPLIIGTIDRDPFQRRVFYNSVFLINKKTAYIAPYYKRHLVPLGEFVPFSKTFPFLMKLAPIGDNFGTGKGPQIMDFKPLDTKIGMLICFEDVFPDLGRESVRAGANLLINITNDGWFMESHQQYQHVANAVFRAVENRVPLVRCCNNGYTCLIEPTGRITNTLEDPEHGIFIQGWKKSELSLTNYPPTFYTLYGDVFALACLVITATFWIYRLQCYLVQRQRKN